MFEQFDDPVAFRPDAAFREGVARRAGRIRRRRRVVATGLSSLAAVVLVAGAGFYIDRRDAAIDRVDVATNPSVDGATNVLLVGVDGPLDEGARADSVAVLRFDDDGARLLSVPRDLYDPVGELRISAASVEGPQAVIDAVHRATGIPIDHLVALEPEGFVALVDAAGGLRLGVHRLLVDEPTGLALEPAACTTLDGPTALALARARGIDPSGDLGRIRRQQAMLGAALDQIDADPATIDRLSRLLADHAIVDDGLDLARLVDLGTRLASGPPLVTETLPVLPVGLPSGAQVLTLDDGAVAMVQSYGATGDLPEIVVEPAVGGPGPSGEEAAGDLGPCP